MINIHSVGSKTFLNQMDNKSNIISDDDFISKTIIKNYEKYNIKELIKFWYSSNNFFISDRIEGHYIFRIFRDSYCLVYIFDLSNIDTLYKLPEMIINYIYTDSIRQFSENIPIFIIGNKSDIKREKIYI